MPNRDRAGSEDGRLTVRQLSLLFLALVAVCAVFFSLGFIVGHSQRAPNAVPQTQQVAAPTGDVPASVNAPLEDEPVPGNTGDAVTSKSNQPSGQTGASTAQPAANPAAVPATPPPEASESTRQEAPKHANTRESANGSQAESEPPRSISLQVAASHVREDAESMVKMLKSRGYSAYLMTPQRARASDGLYRVEVGPFRSRGAADRVRRRLGEEGFKSFVRK